jgi:hypothetical protein
VDQEGKEGTRMRGAIAYNKGGMNRGGGREREKSSLSLIILSCALLTEREREGKIGRA